MQFVHHSNYLKYFELARLGVAHSTMGVSYAEMEQQGILMPVVRGTYWHLKRHLYYGDEFEVSVKFRKIYHEQH